MGKNFHFIAKGTVRRFMEKNMDAFDVLVFVVEPIDEVWVDFWFYIYIYIYIYIYNVFLYAKNHTSE